MADDQNEVPSAQRGLDQGPFYTETPVQIREMQPYSGSVAEPWNTVTAFLFVVIVVVWLFRLGRRIKRYPFFALTLPLLLIGGVGGTLYHGMRNWVGFFLMDVIPIYLLGVIVAVYWWIRLGPKLWHVAIMVAILGLLQLLPRTTMPQHLAINLSYAALALLILVPLVLVLIRTKCRHVGWVATALVSFGIAWLFRLLDTQKPPLLPMGTHWLWHTFGAITTAAISEYVYRIEGMPLRKPAPSPATLP